MIYLPVLPEGVPECPSYRRGRGKNICFCHHPDNGGSAVDFDVCRACHRLAGHAPVAVPRKLKVRRHVLPQRPVPVTRTLKEGPGTEFEKLTEKLRLRKLSNCSCNTLIRRMNQLGVSGCRRERPKLLVDMKANYSLYGTSDKLWAAFHAITTGLAFKVDPLDPLPGLLDEAIIRAEKRGEPESLHSVKPALPRGEST